MIEVIDKELSIEALNVCDLTMEQAQLFIEQFGSGYSLSTLTLFCDLETGIVTLNKDFPDYEVFKYLTIAYLGSDEATRAKIRGYNIQLDALRILDAALRCRGVKTA